LFHALGQGGRPNLWLAPFLHLAVVIVQHSSHGSGVDAMIGKDRGVMCNIMPRSTE
jgi:hypothetical protein